MLAAHSEMVQGYRAVSRRLWNPRKPWSTPRVDLVADYTGIEKVAQEYLTPARRILRDVAERHGVSPRDILGPRCLKVFTIPRFEFYYRVVSETKLSFPQIGRICGGRDHTTVLHGVRSYCERNGLPFPRAPRGW